MNVYHNGYEAFGEIVSIDETQREASLMLIPSEERVVVPLNSLTWVDPRDDDAEPPVVPDSNLSPHVPHPVTDAKPPSGKLFSSPGDQLRLF